VVGLARAGEFVGVLFALQHQGRGRGKVAVIVAMGVWGPLHQHVEGADLGLRAEHSQRIVNFEVKPGTAHKVQLFDMAGIELEFRRHAKSLRPAYLIRP